MTCASPGSCAPWGVHFQAFDADGWTSGVIQPASGDPADLDYMWTFGGSAATWALSGKSKNTGYGHGQYHTYDTPGTKDVACSVIDESLNVTVYTEAVTVTDPDVVFAGEGTNTYFFDSVAGLDANAGTQASPKQTLAHALTLVAAGKRIRFKFGQTFTDAGGSLQLAHNTGPFMMDAWGTAGTRDARGIADNAPILQMTTDGTFLQFRGAVADKNWRLVDLHLKGNSGDVTGTIVAFWNTECQRSILFWRCELDTGNNGFLLPHVDEDAYVQANASERIFFADCYFHDTNNKPFIGAARKMVWAGCKLRNSATSHVLRITWSRLAVIKDVELSECGANLHTAKFHSAEFSAGFESLYWLIQDCKFWKGNSNSPVSFGPQDDVSDERIRYWVIESNLFACDEVVGTTIDLVTHYGSQCTYRSNVFDMSGSHNSAQCMNIGKRANHVANPTFMVPTGNKIYHNTFYRDSASSINFYGIYLAPNGVDFPCADTTLKNNVAYISGGSPDSRLVRINAGATGTIGGGGSPAGADGNNLLNPTTPGFVDGPNQNWALLAGSDLTGGGLDVSPVVRRTRDDLYWIGTTFGRGAYGYNLGGHPGGGAAPSQPARKRWANVPGMRPDRRLF